MISLLLSEITAHLEGELIGLDKTIAKVSTDSRSLKGGELFIALEGPRFDGHQFIDLAEQQGVSAVLVSRKVETNLPQIIVADTQLALGQLGALVKAKVAPMTAAITGSNGKTTVKEMVAHIVKNLGPTLVTKGNFNNEIGVPLTLLCLEPQHQYAVVELGANHKGEIAYSTGLVKPDVALVNNAYEAHIEGFGSLLGVAQAKSEIFSGLNDNGVAIINLDSPYCRLWLDKVENKKVISYSRLGEKADVQASGIELNEFGHAIFTLIVDGERLPLHLLTPGLHNVDNALAAAAVAKGMGAANEQIISGLATYHGVKQRLERHQLTRTIALIDDSYNANIASVKAAIDVLALQSGKQILVLGDMAELGSAGRTHHQELGQYALEQGIDRLFCVGELSLYTAKAAGKRAQHFAHKNDAIESLINELIENKNLPTTILVKGSHSSGMNIVVEKLKQKYEAGAIC